MIHVGYWDGDLEFMVVWIDDFQALLRLEFKKIFKVMIILHVRKVYIYDRWEDDPIGVAIVKFGSTWCKLKTMNVVDIK